jgi:hypothetical protein
MDIITFIKVDGLKWAGHVAKAEGRRKGGRPKLRWEDEVDNDKALGGKKLEKP